MNNPDVIKPAEGVNGGSLKQPGSVAAERPLPTIEELERMLASNEPLDIEIQPDGSIRAVPEGTAKNSNAKPITARYAAAEYY